MKLSRKLLSLGVLAFLMLSCADEKDMKKETSQFQSAG